jgi:hypothetical protein
MTNGNCIHFNVSRCAAVRDAAVVTFLALVLGAFVAQVSAGPRSTHRSLTVASATQDARPNG